MPSPEFPVPLDSSPKSVIHRSLRFPISIPLKNENEQGLSGLVVQEPTVGVQGSSDSEIVGDGFRWRKYGQKVVKGNPYPRNNYCLPVSIAIVANMSLDNQLCLTKRLNGRAEVTTDAPISSATCASTSRELQMIRRPLSRHTRENTTTACPSKTQIQQHVNRIHRLQLRRASHDPC
ncbi:hypothetical protein RHGRI_016182 [Rhododendron griersonianum]|uniref:WRKY domain-containing protein n=1 Tax=Rhododendron griersonianum TaxID=479676 RepID=A0AAV6JSU5_9ERIC|nr:hypothetical protein RHGRI_016182 [Rhododendron griersonianum]